MVTTGKITDMNKLKLQSRIRVEARRGKARQGEARRGEARQGEARRGEARRGKARHLYTKTQLRTHSKIQKSSHGSSSSYTLYSSSTGNRKHHQRSGLNIQGRTPSGSLECKCLGQMSQLHLLLWNVIKTHYFHIIYTLMLQQLLKKVISSTVSIFSLHEVKK